MRNTKLRLKEIRRENCLNVESRIFLLSDCLKEREREGRERERSESVCVNAFF